MSYKLKSALQTLVSLEDEKKDHFLALFLDRKRKENTDQDSSGWNEIKIFCPKCNTEVAHTAEGIQQDQIRILIAKVYHYFEQEYEELKNIYGDLDLNPLSKFRQRTALATGVSETTLLQILKEEERRNADRQREQRTARKRHRQTDSSSEECSSDDNVVDDQHPSSAHETQTVVIKIEQQTDNNEEPEMFLPIEVQLEPVSSDINNVLIKTDPISVDVKFEPRGDEVDTVQTMEVKQEQPQQNNTNENIAVNQPAARKERKKTTSNPSIRTEKSIAVNEPATPKSEGRKTTRNSDPLTRAQIIALHNQGKNLSEIAREVGVNRKTVLLWVRRFKEEGSLEHHQRSGRPRLINTLQRQTMIREYEEHGFLPTYHYAGLFDTSVDTVRRTLHREGLHYRRHAVKPLLTDNQKKARLQFALDHINFDWSNVIFTDEKTFEASEQGRLCLWRRNTRYTSPTSGQAVPNMQSGDITVNMWGWMSADGPGELVRLRNSGNYIDVLEETMLPTVRNVYPREELPQIQIVQDNSPIYHSHSVQTWFRQRNDISVIPWPANSPDLNPIENLWGVIVQRWDNSNERTPESLEAHCLQIWDSIRGSELCTNLVNSMRTRMQAVIDQNGGYTSF